ncbi:MAG TPA: class I SAM-dependent methyltransferase [Vicinamibacterales bacterium]|nr:class I SAM-dependent methyltransferase [Vicinamibacterales bacterium]
MRILEIGTGTGDKTIALAKQLRGGDMLLTMEADADKAAVARRRFAAAGFDTQVSVIVGDPARFLHKLRGPFDVIVLPDASGLRMKVEALLAPRGVLIRTNGDTIVVNDMTITEWLAHARADAEQRGLPELIPMLEGLAQATERLRAADWNDNADASTPFDPDDRTQDKPRT